MAHMYGIDTRGMGEAMTLTFTLHHAHDRFSQVFPKTVLNGQAFLNKLFFCQAGHVQARVWAK